MHFANLHSETVVRRCSVKEVFLKISKNLQENTCAIVSFKIKLQASGCLRFVGDKLVLRDAVANLTKEQFFYRAALGASLTDE